MDIFQPKYLYSKHRIRKVNKFEAKMKKQLIKIFTKTIIQVRMDIYFKGL